MVSYEFDKIHVRQFVSHDLAACRKHDYRVDATLKDAETVQNDKTRIRHWGQLVLDMIPEACN